MQLSRSAARYRQRALGENTPAPILPGKGGGKISLQSPFPARTHTKLSPFAGAARDQGWLFLLVGVPEAAGAKPASSAFLLFPGKPQRLEKPQGWKKTTKSFCSTVRNSTRREKGTAWWVLAPSALHPAPSLSSVPNQLQRERKLADFLGFFQLIQRLQSCPSLFAGGGASLAEPTARSAGR